MPTFSIHFTSCRFFLLRKFMLSRFSLPTLIVLLTCTLLTALLPFLAASLSASHDLMINIQAQQGRHVQTAWAEQNASAHPHEDSAIDESHWGQPPVHSASDHTHDPLFVAPFEHALSFSTCLLKWSLPDSLIRPSAPVATLERPPKPTIA